MEAGNESIGKRTKVPMYLLMVVFAGWLNRQQQAAIEYLKTEKEILKSQLKGRRLRANAGAHAPTTKKSFLDHW